MLKHVETVLQKDTAKGVLQQGFECSPFRKWIQPIWGLDSNAGKTTPDAAFDSLGDVADEDLSTCDKNTRATSPTDPAPRHRLESAKLHGRPLPSKGATCGARRCQPGTVVMATCFCNEREHVSTCVGKEPLCTMFRFRMGSMQP